MKQEGVFLRKISLRKLRVPILLTFVSSYVTYFICSVSVSPIQCSNYVTGMLLFISVIQTDKASPGDNFLIKLSNLDEKPLLNIDSKSGKLVLPSNIQ